MFLVCKRLNTDTKSTKKVWLKGSNKWSQDRREALHFKNLDDAIDATVGYQGSRILEYFPPSQQHLVNSTAFDYKDGIKRPQDYPKYRESVQVVEELKLVEVA